jgi:hypothetical protein
VSERLLEANGYPGLLSSLPLRQAANEDAALLDRGTRRKLVSTGDNAQTRRKKVTVVGRAPRLAAVVNASPAGREGARPRRQARHPLPGEYPQGTTAKPAGEQEETGR